VQGASHSARVNSPLARRVSSLDPLLDCGAIRVSERDPALGEELTRC